MADEPKDEPNQAYTVIYEGIDFKVVDPDGNVVKTFGDSYSPKAFVAALNAAYLRGWHEGQRSRDCRAH